MTSTLIQHELDRIHSMTDSELTNRYVKMTKQDKIRAFHDALEQTNRHSYLRKSIAQDLGLTGRFDFIDIVTHAENQKQAIFQYIGPRYHFDNGEGFIEDGETFLYSYSFNEMTQPSGETMVFRCLPTGDITNMGGVFQESGYVRTNYVMNVENLHKWYTL